jgi:hypothetical protein
MSSTVLDDNVAPDGDQPHDDSFDSLPPGEKYHCPPFEEDPFDTSAIVIPEVTRPPPEDFYSKVSILRGIYTDQTFLSDQTRHIK